MMMRADSAPARWPSIRGKWRCRAQRPLPSMMIATWRGNEDLASGLRWTVGELIVAGCRLQVESCRLQVESCRLSAPRQNSVPTCNFQLSTCNSQEDRLLAAGADGGDHQFCVRKLRNRFEVGPRFGREVLPFARFVRGRLPAGEFGIDGLAARQDLGVVGHVIVTLSAHAVSDADFDSFQGI